MPSVEKNEEDLKTLPSALAQGLYIALVKAKTRPTNPKFVFAMIKMYSN